MSEAALANPEKARPGAAPLPRKVWRAPRVIVAEDCHDAAKFNIYEPEGHFFASSSFDS
jgi:hypothetical protein